MHLSAKVSNIVGFVLVVTPPAHWLTANWWYHPRAILQGALRVDKVSRWYHVLPRACLTGRPHRQSFRLNSHSATEAVDFRKEGSRILLVLSPQPWVDTLTTD